MAEKSTYEELEQRVEELEEEVVGRKRAEEALQKRTYDLGEREKELNCLYGIARLVEKSDTSLEEILEGTIKLIPPAWQYPETTCARAILDDRQFTTGNFQETIWKQVSDVIVYGERIGVLEVFCLEEKPERDEGPFLIEERSLIDAISERLGRIIARKRAEETLQKSERQLRLLSSRLLTAQENERKGIARELHDSIGNSLTVIKMALEQVYSQSVNSAAMPGVQSLEAAILLVRETIREVRRMQTGLRPPLLDHLGIVATISWICGEFKKLYSGIRVEEQTSIEEKDVPDALRIVIFRVLQEAFNNIAKYANADLVRVSIKKTDGKIELAIGDNGVGFDVEHVKSLGNSHGGFGLTTMKERTELSGGSFSIESNKGAGSIIRASWQC
jgi:two-component system NarL family sensor kinase